MATKKTTSKAAPSVPDINFGEGAGAPDTSPPNVPSPDNIYGAILAIMREVGYVQKRSSPGVNFKFASDQDLIKAIRPWMVHFGVIMHVVDVADLDQQDRTRERGGNTRHVSMTAVVRFYHVHSGSYIDVKARGEGADVSDKAWNKAQTGARKYAILQSFAIETGADPDASPNPPPSRAEAAGLVKRDPSPPPEPWDLDEPGREADQPKAEMSAPATPPPAVPTMPSLPRVEPPAGPKARLARLDVTDAVEADWKTWTKKLIERFPRYSLQRQGKPTDQVDKAHLRATAGHLGFESITDGNFKRVLESIAQHAERQDKEAVAALTTHGEDLPERPATAKSPEAANRPSTAPRKVANDDALKRAGF